MAFNIIFNEDSYIIDTAEDGQPQCLFDPDGETIEEYYPGRDAQPGHSVDPLCTLFRIYSTDYRDDQAESDETGTTAWVQIDNTARRQFSNSFVWPFKGVGFELNNIVVENASNVEVKDQFIATTKIIV